MRRLRCQVCGKYVDIGDLCVKRYTVGDQHPSGLYTRAVRHCKHHAPDECGQVAIRSTDEVSREI